MRQAQASSRACIGTDVFSTVEDEYIVQLGSDVAVLFEDSVWLGKLLRIRRKYQTGGWNDYLRPVNLDEAKAQGWKLWFTLGWFRKRPGNVRTYEFGVSDTKPVPLSCIICPVALTSKGNNLFTLCAEQWSTVESARASVEREGQRSKQTRKPRRCAK